MELRLIELMTTMLPVTKFDMLEHIQQSVTQARLFVAL